LRRNRSQCADKDRPNGVELSVQKRKTDLYLIRSRIAVTGRATLNDVANVNLVTGQIYGADDFGQQLPGRSHKWLSLSIFIKAWPLAHKYEFCCRTAGTEDDVTAMLCKPATPAIAQFHANIRQGFTRLLRRHTPGGQFCETVGMAIKSTKSASGEPLKGMA
jgi:hypothetical protein